MFFEIKEEVNCLQKDHDTFQQGNASAGRRVRSTLQEVKKNRTGNANHYPRHQKRKIDF